MTILLILLILFLINVPPLIKIFFRTVHSNIGIVYKLIKSSNRIGKEMNTILAVLPKIKIKLYMKKKGIYIFISFCNVSHDRKVFPNYLPKIEDFLYDFKIS